MDIVLILNLSSRSEAIFACRRLARVKELARSPHHHCAIGIRFGIPTHPQTLLIQSPSVETSCRGASRGWFVAEMMVRLTLGFKRTRLPLKES